VAAALLPAAAAGGDCTGKEDREVGVEPVQEAYYAAAAAAPVAAAPVAAAEPWVHDLCSRLLASLQ
jgi:hypothetical protein